MASSYYRVRIGCAPLALSSRYPVFTLEKLARPSDTRGSWVKTPLPSRSRNQPFAPQEAGSSSQVSRSGSLLVARNENQELRRTGSSTEGILRDRRRALSRQPTTLRPPPTSTSPDTPGEPASASDFPGSSAGTTGRGQLDALLRSGDLRSATDASWLQGPMVASRQSGTDAGRSLGWSE